MSTIETVLKLIDAGYTKEEIAALTAEPAEKTPAPEAKPAEPTPAPEAKPAEPTPAPEAKPAETQYDILVKKLEEISNRIITNNINVDTMNGTPGKTVDDILANVINPPQPEKK